MSNASWNRRGLAWFSLPPLPLRVFERKNEEFKLALGSVCEEL
jgi:hypothetical protein